MEAYVGVQVYLFHRKELGVMSVPNNHSLLVMLGLFMCTLSLKFIKAAYPQETLVQEASHRENPDIAKATPRYVYDSVYVTFSSP